MLLLNCCIAFIVDNVRQNKRKRRNRNSSIIRRQPKQRSVSFSDPLVVRTVPTGSARRKTRVQSTQGQVEEIEMTNLGPTRGAIPVPPPPPPPPPPPLKPTRPVPSIPAKPLTPMPGSMTRIRPLDFPNFPPPAPPLARTMSTRLPHRDPSYKTFTIILC